MESESLARALRVTFGNHFATFVSIGCKTRLVASKVSKIALGGTAALSRVGGVIFLNEEIGSKAANLRNKTALGMEPRRGSFNLIGPLWAT